MFFFPLLMMHILSESFQKWMGCCACKEKRTGVCHYTWYGIGIMWIPQWDFFFIYLSIFIQEASWIKSQGNERRHDSSRALNFTQNSHCIDVLSSLSKWMGSGWPAVGEKSTGTRKKIQQAYLNPLHVDGLQVTGQGLVIREWVIRKGY